MTHLEYSTLKQCEFRRRLRNCSEETNFIGEHLFVSGFILGRRYFSDADDCSDAYQLHN